jgi:adenylylsulfate reductase subunit A
MSLFSSRKTHVVDTDILVIGGGFGGCGATYESRYWGRKLKVTLVEKANIERSGAVAHGLSAINCTWACAGMKTSRRTCPLRARRPDGAGARTDLRIRHVDGTVHLFEEWGC